MTVKAIISSLVAAHDNRHTSQCECVSKHWRACGVWWGYVYMDKCGWMFHFLHLPLQISHLGSSLALFIIAIISIHYYYCICTCMENLQTKHILVVFQLV